MVKDKGGRPPKYKPEYCDKLVDYFNIEPYIEREIPHYDRQGNLTYNDSRRVANRLPTLRSFAKEIGVHISTVYNWLDPKNPQFQDKFLDAFTHAQEIRKWFLIENGLEGLYNANFAIFTAKNITDMADRQQIEVRTIEDLLDEV